jgi:cell wall-associated NlpC family hydrolase
MVIVMTISRVRAAASAGVIALAAWSAACASTGAVPRPFPTPGGSAAHRVPAPAPASAPAEAPESAPPAAPVVPAAPAPSPAVNRAGLDGYAVAGTALGLRGVPYRNGGGDPSGFDCSGFTQYVFAQHGVSLPRDVRSQFRKGTPVKPEELAPGDVIFFTTSEPGPSHVAIAIGGDEFVHAPSSSGVVRVEHLSSSYWSPRFLGARRLGN